jgi:hypothetical protein
MSGRRGFDLSVAANNNRDMFSKKVALQRILNRGESAFLEFILHGLPEDVAFDRIKRAISLSKVSFQTIFGPDFDEEVFRDFIPTAYEISVAHPHDDDRATKIMSNYLKIAAESADAIWPEGAPKKAFPFSPQHALAPTLASITMKLTKCANTYDLRVGKTLFIKAISTMIVEFSVDLAQRMMPEAGRGEITSLTQSLIKRVGLLAIESWRETAAEMIPRLRVLPESERSAAATAYNPMLKIRTRIRVSLASVPEFLISMNDIIEEEISRALVKPHDTLDLKPETTSAPGV